MAQDMMIYWGSGSAPCWMALITLEEKGLQGYKHKLISFEKKEHKSEEVLKLNPRGQVRIPIITSFKILCTQVIRNTNKS